jgi:hypothetical protein
VKKPIETKPQFVPATIHQLIRIKRLEADIVRLKAILAKMDQRPIDVALREAFADGWKPVERS